MPTLRPAQSGPPCPPRARTAAREGVPGTASLARVAGPVAPLNGSPVGTNASLGESSTSPDGGGSGRSGCCRGAGATVPVRPDLLSSSGIRHGPVPSRRGDVQPCPVLASDRPRDRRPRRPCGPHAPPGCPMIGEIRPRAIAGTQRTFARRFGRLRLDAALLGLAVASVAMIAAWYVLLPLSLI